MKQYPAPLLKPARMLALSPDSVHRNQMIIKDRICGSSIAELATKFGLSETRVRQIAGRAQPLIPKRRPPPKLRARPARAERFRLLKLAAVDLRKRGFSYRQIASRVGISVATAYASTHRVKIFSLEGRAWKSHAEGRPKEWKRSLARPRECMPPL